MSIVKRMIFIIRFTIFYHCHVIQIRVPLPTKKSFNSLFLTSSVLFHFNSFLLLKNLN
ncbi:hypothetical protein C1646_719864, partial [Rhizophagus diaphanus]